MFYLRVSEKVTSLRMKEKYVVHYSDAVPLVISCLSHLPFMSSSVHLHYLHHVSSHVYNVL